MLSVVNRLLPGTCTQAYTSGARHPKRAKDGLTMTTIDELLKIAQENIGYARLTNTMDQAERGICATIAQAAAQTAQAMIWREQMQDMAANNEIPGWYEGQPSAGAPF
jgi:hypothetical protein